MQAWKKRVINAVSSTVLASLLLTPAVQAAEPGQSSPYGSEPQATFVNTADDGGSWEVGIHGTAGDLTAATAAERYGMWYWLSGWFVLRHYFDESTSWEEDFKRAALGGTEQNYIDNVDLQFYVGHGSPGRFTFANNTHDDGSLSARNDCLSSWGDRDNEWFAITSCQVLSDANNGRHEMAMCMNGQHLILGFVTNASAHNNWRDTQSYHFGRYMRSGWSMTSSWFKACDIAQRNRVARVIAEETSCYNDNPYYSSVCSDASLTLANYHWQTHNCGTEMARPIESGELPIALPILRVAPAALDETANINKFSRLSAALGVTGTVASAGISEGPGDPPVDLSGNFISVTSTASKTLEVDKSSGIVSYADLNNLWTTQAVEQAMAVSASDANYIDNNAATQIANSFLSAKGLMGANAQHFETIADTAADLSRSAVGAAAIVAETPTLWQVIYSQVISVPVVSAAGADAAMEFVIIGPGSKQKVYVPTAAVSGTVSAAGILATDPVGLQAGWRDLEVQVNAATGQEIMVDLTGEAQARALFEALGDGVTMASLPMEISKTVLLTGTVSYWMNAAGTSQAEAIPVYQFDAEVTEKGTGVVTMDHVHVPANTKYMKPYAAITNTPTSGVNSGTEIILTAADAAQTLKTLGVGDSFDFVMGYNGKDSDFLYEWYIGGVAPENKIVDQEPQDGSRNVTLKIPRLQDDKGGVLDVILVVTDASSPNQSQSMATASILINPSVFLPLVTK